MNSAKPTPPTPKGPERYRRWLRRAGWLAFASLAAVLIFLGALRLYYSDERLRELLVDYLNQRLDGQVALRELDSSLFSGIELRGLRIGPPAGFKRDFVLAERIAVHWSAFHLVLLEVVVPEIAVESLHLSLEEHESRMNLDVIVSQLFPPGDPSEDVGPQEPSDEATPLQQPNLPFPIRVESLRLSGIDFTMDVPDTLLEITDYGLEAEFEGAGGQLALDLWTGVGNRDDPKTPDPGARAGTLRLVQPNLRIEATPKIDIEVESTGFGDIQLNTAIFVGVQLEVPDPLPPVTVALAVSAKSSLLNQNIDVTTLELTVNDDSSVVVSATINDFLDRLALALRQVQIRLQLDELSPIIGAFVPEMKLGGTLNLDLIPTELSDFDPVALSQLTTGLKLTTHKAAFSIPGLTSKGLDLSIEMTSVTGNTVLASRWLIESLNTPGQQQFRNVDMALNATAPLSGFLGGEPHGTVVASLAIDASSAGGPAARAAGLRLRLEAESLVSTIFGGTSHEHPLIGTLDVRARRLTVPTTEFQNVRIRLDASLEDIIAENSKAKLQVHTGSAALAAGEESIRVSGVEINLDARRAGSNINVRGLELGIGDLVGLNAAGGLKLRSPLGFDAVNLKLEVPRVEDVITSLPVSMRPPAQIAGGVSLTIEANGRLDSDFLANVFVPKTPTIPDGAEPWSYEMRNYEDYLDGIMNGLTGGLPLRASVGVAVDDLEFHDESNFVKGFDATADIQLQSNGVQLNTTMDIAELIRPVAGRDLKTKSSIRIGERQVVLDLDAGITSFTPPDEETLEGTSHQLRLTYEVGGDLELEKFSLEVPNRGFTFASSGLIAKPMRALILKAWAQPQLPSMDATLRVDFGLERSELGALAKGSPLVSGTANWSSALELREGVATFTGTLSTEEFSVVSGDMVIEEVTGSLPLEARIAFDPREDAAILPYDLGLGSGVLAILTPSFDIRSRAARPVYYSRVRPYRERAGLQIRTLLNGPFEIRNIELDGRLKDGILVADHLAFQLLGGDVLGSIALQLSRERHLLGDLDLKFSGVDASNFSKLNLKPGPDTEMSADVQTSFVFAPTQRDLTMNMNVTKIGSNTFDRFLQLLDPESQDPAIQGTRGNLKWIRVNEIAMWIRFENLNMDLDATALLRIPGTGISVPKVERELLRRFAIGEILDVNLQPQIDQHLAPALGWVK